MNVIILAGGLGTRLRSVVIDVPKCMAQICNKPFLYYLLKYLSTYKVNKVILSVGYLHESIIEWINHESYQFPFKIEFILESEPLGTGGGIKLALSKASSEVVCILNGDTFFNVDLNKFLSRHKESNSLLSIALKPMANFDRYGNVDIDKDEIITSFEEKRYCTTGLINGGVVLMNMDTNFFDRLPAKFSFETDFLQVNAQKRIFHGFVFNGYFIDIGIPEDYAKANVDFKSLY